MPAMTPEVPSALSPLVRRVVANNPSLMTGPGTNTYLVGIDEVAVIDPGPDDAGHIDAIIGASMRERVRWVLLTHTHPDHAPGTKRLVKETGAEVLAFTKKPKDGDVIPDRVIGEGATIEGTEFGLEVLHTPGHAPDHLCFWHAASRSLFCGDLLISGGTVWIPGDDNGDVAAYIASLERVQALQPERAYPAHGPIIEDPVRLIGNYIRHRQDREAQVIDALRQGDTTVEAMTARIYRGLKAALVPLARQSVTAHLRKLAREGRARSEADAWNIIEP